MTDEAPNRFQLERATGQNYLTLLQEVDSIGLAGFLKMIDECTDDELHQLLQVCDVVYQKIQAHKLKYPVATPPKAG